jgi:tetratricopeptide (TPR) repeat protein
MEWTQVFGYFEGDPRTIHSPDYAAACAYVDRQLKARFSAGDMRALDETFNRQADSAVVRVLAQASGWGALEVRRMQKMGAQDQIPCALVFPPETLGPEQQKWLDLLESGELAEPDPAQLPGEWMVQDEWQEILAQSPRKHWFSRLHEGVMLMEHFQPAQAVAAWQESMRLRPSAWAARNLAVTCLRQGQAEAALAYYRQAWELMQASGQPSTALAVECLQALVKARQFAEGLALYQALPTDIQKFDRIQILFGRIALELGRLDKVEKVLSREYAVIREGELELTDLWTEMCLRREIAAGAVLQIKAKPAVFGSLLLSSALLAASLLHAQVPEGIAGLLWGAPGGMLSMMGLSGIAGDEKDEEARCERVESTEVADASLAVDPAHELNDVVRRDIRGLVDEQQAFSVASHAGLSRYGLRPFLRTKLNHSRIPGSPIQT